MGILRLDASDSSEMRWFDMPQGRCYCSIVSISNGTGDLLRATRVEKSDVVDLVSQSLVNESNSVAISSSIVDQTSCCCSVLWLADDGLKPKTYCAFHVLNAWEETMEQTGGPGGVAPNTSSVIKIHTCDTKHLDLDFRKAAHGVDQDSLPFLHTVILKLDTGEVIRHSVLPEKPFVEGMDFPQLRRSLVGRKNRFGYCTTFNSKGDAAAEVKVDLQAAKPELAQVGRIAYEDGFVGGECIFIPSKPDDHAGHDGDNDGDGEPEGGEDDGYLATFVSRKDGTGNSGETNSLGYGSMA
ncbi:unnamed protein product [Ectocarpus sp. CCAP 1310/34]|nr:unnamed protein product [Ectocarpus sp. CCAP 1310/34]